MPDVSKTEAICDVKIIGKASEPKIPNHND